MVEAKISSCGWGSLVLIGNAFGPGAGALVAGIGLSRTVLAQRQPSLQQTAAALDSMIAGHKSDQDLAQYVFDTHGCKSCHTVGQNGKLGLHFQRAPAR